MAQNVRSNLVWAWLAALTGKRQVGLRVWDRPEQLLQPVIELSDKLARATTDEERVKIHAQIDAVAKSWGPHPVVVRFFAGKNADDAIVKLADKQGRPRLVLKVDGAGVASIEFLTNAVGLLEGLFQVRN